MSEDTMTTKYEAVIGLEIHAELKTKTKMFCYSLNDPNERHPNMNICPVCTGHPGTLPVINEDAVKKVIKVGLALHGTIPEYSRFDRKNYFYPDLPKGYQISQYKHPLVRGGFLEVLGKKFRITRVHLEEDAGRLIHDKDSNASLVNFNRAGVPLMELVTEPDFRSGEEVKKFGEELQRILRYVDASEAHMEKGQLRVEVNISLRPEITHDKLQMTNPLGTKVEIKNINSFKFAADAIEYEIKRQSALLDAGESVKQETRGWNENKNESFSQRSKEEAHDYRYFPEPDVPPLRITPEMRESLRAELPELPDAKRVRFVKEYGLEPDIIEILVREKKLAEYFENAVSETKQYEKETPEKPRKNLTKLVGAMITGELMRLMEKAISDIGDILVSPSYLGKLVAYLAEDKISNLAAKQVLEEVFRSGDDPLAIIERLGLGQIQDTNVIEDIARHIVKENPTTVGDYRKGKVPALQYLVGQVMKESRGKANPKIAQEVMRKLVDSL